MESSQEKSLPASERKLQKAREDGQGARSRDLSHLAILGAGAACMLLLAPQLMDRMQWAMSQQLAFNAANGITPRSVVKNVRDLIDGVYSEKAGKEADRLERDAMARAKVEEMSEKDISREIKRLEKLMLEHARNLEFEKAAQVRDQLHILKEQAFGAPGADNVVVIASTGAAPRL